MYLFSHCHLNLSTPYFTSFRRNISGKFAVRNYHHGELPTLKINARELIPARSGSYGTRFAETPDKTVGTFRLLDQGHPSFSRRLQIRNRVTQVGNYFIETGSRIT